VRRCSERATVDNGESCKQDYEQYELLERLVS
jgi:hypothetical protein